MLKNGYYSVLGHGDSTFGLVDGRWVGVKVTDSMAEWVAVNGDRASEVHSQASSNPILESVTGTGGIAMGPGGPGYSILPPSTNRPPRPVKKTKKKTEAKKESDQVILGDTDETETHEEDIFVNRLTNAINDGLLERRRQFCTRCKCDRTFAEAEGDRMRCIVCTHSLFRVDSHFSTIAGKGMYSPPPKVSAIREEWRPGMDIPEDLDPSLLAKVVQATNPASGTGAVGMNSRLKNLKDKESKVKNKAQEDKETEDEMNKLKKKLESQTP